MLDVQFEIMNIDTKLWLILAVVMYNGRCEDTVLPAGEVLHENIKILFYNNTEQKMKFQSALDFCASLKGSLLLIKDNGIQLKVTEQLAQWESSVDQSECGNNCWHLGYWVGAREYNNQWMWLDNSAVDGVYQNWYRNQPNGGNATAYAMKVMPIDQVKTTSGILGKWGDDNANQKKNFICQLHLCNGYECANGGNCTLDLATSSLKCICINGYSGKTCQIEPNVTLPCNATKQKKYEYKFFNYPPLNYTTANERCVEEGNGYQLVKVNSSFIQDDINSQIQKWAYDFDEQSWTNASEAGYWAGGDKTRGDWYWLDGTSIPLQSTVEFENWLDGFPLVSSRLSALQILLTNSSFSDEVNGDILGKWVDGMIIQKKRYICQRLYNPCSVDNPCLNGGECLPELNHIQSSFKCICSDGYYGDICQYDPCTVNPCENNGTCSLETQSDCGLLYIIGGSGDECEVTNTTAYRCDCIVGYHGINCTQDLCTNNPCLNNGTCNMNGSDYQCQCVGDFFGRNCTEVPDPCNSLYCGSNGKCIVVNSTALCQCYVGYYGQYCENDLCTHNPCMNNGTCNMNGSDYQCQCLDGYYGKNCTNDLCTNNPCLNNGTCNMNGSDYQCQCVGGFFGKNCSTPEPCIPSPCGSHGLCIVRNTTEYYCLCDDGYYGNECQNNPCTIQPCQNDGDCQVNNSSYTCECKTGFFGINCTQDYCSQDPCMNGGNCSINGTSYACDCPPTYSGFNCTEAIFFTDDAVGFSIHLSVDSLTNFTTSLTTCMDLGGALVIVKTQNTQTFLERYISNITDMNGFWIGAQNVSGEWLWLDGSSVNNQDFEKWPPETQQLNGNCLSLQRQNIESEFVWIPKDCNAPIGYICEKPADGEDPCIPTPCLHNSVCTSSGAHFYCNCSDLYSGNLCERPLNTPSPPFQPWLIVVIVISTAQILFLTVFLCYYVHSFRDQRQKKSKKEHHIDLSNYENSCFQPASNYSNYRITVNQMFDKYRELTSFNNRAFITQFDDISSISSKVPISATVAKLPENKDKNRYVNVYPSDNARVVLQGDQDYINASYIDSYGMPKKFIAAQGPTRDTVVDFWNMIWEQNCQIIVMLTNLFEDALKKCEKYWPEIGFVDRFGEILVETTEDISYGSYTIRTFRVFVANSNDENCCKTVKHLHFNSWPDHGVPVSTTAFLKFYDIVMETYQRDFVLTPIVVHCSAGVGRSGTFIALDSLLEEQRATQAVNVFETVLAMRRKRTLMVQTSSQYIFLHRLMVELLCLPKTEFSILEIEKIMTNLAKKDENLVIGFEKEFDNLNIIGPIDTQRGIALQPKNFPKNMFQDILPYDKSILKLPPLKADEQPAYYNASLILCDLGHIVASQCPFDETVVDFWHAVWHSDAKTIVMITSKEEEPNVHPYFPPKISLPETYNDMNIYLTKQEKQPNVTKRFLRIENGQSKMDIKHFHYHDWPSASPPNKQSVLNFLDMVQRCWKTEDGALLVHCSDGSGRTGVFITLLKLIDLLKHGANHLDVFRTVKDLRDIRPWFVTNKQQYHFIYTALSTYISTMLGEKEADC
uniref:uncharacterized protein LOC100178651 isoform X2 n=1 Tax=Ciona intestinalis TaxID=7719 RepID=UPI000EF54B30|nr:uncharacterized protein LOC100178651 isoform X2 [Ciona intestinalis]|eukprot:XP_026696396.1 uncharacterized protein LOC100178651 isoform X2 [Ciona intestinalis]